ncbi:MAG: hypothetical protein JOZ19_13135 [Rubrobacter sp.]|nr:hypothetical protein [Rubrobacter sp.]
MQAHSVSPSSVVETGFDLQAKGHPPAHADDAPDQVVGQVSLRADRHEVLQFPDPIGAKEAGDQDVGVRYVQLFGSPARRAWGYRPVTAALFIQDPPEQAQGVEAWAAVPIYRAVRAYECDRVEVTNQTIFGKRQ